MDNAILTTNAIKAQLKGLEAGRFLSGELISLAGLGRLHAKGTSSVWLEKDSNLAYCNPAVAGPWNILKLNDTEVVILRGGEYGPGLAVSQEDEMVRLVSEDIFFPYPVQRKIFRFRLFDMSVIAFICSNGKYLRADDYISHTKAGTGNLLRGCGSTIDKNSLWFIGVNRMALRGRAEESDLLDSVEKLGAQLAGLQEYGIEFTEEELEVLARQAGFL